MNAIDESVILNGMTYAIEHIQATDLLLNHVHPHTSAQHALRCAIICLREARAALDNKTPTAAPDLTIVIHPRC